MLCRNKQVNGDAQGRQNTRILTQIFRLFFNVEQTFNQEDDIPLLFLIALLGSKSRRIPCWPLPSSSLNQRGPQGLRYNVYRHLSFMLVTRLLFQRDSLQPSSTSFTSGVRLRSSAEKEIPSSGGTRSIVTPPPASRPRQPGSILLMENNFMVSNVFHRFCGSFL